MSEDNKILWISGREPLREGEWPVSYSVGVADVTRISFSERNYGTYGVGMYQVWKGDKLYAEMNHIDIADIRYAD